MCIQKTRVDGMKLSRLCLGGGKMETLPIHEGRSLVYRAMELGINVFDSHHRYGKCEEILGGVPETIKMAKVSAYLAEDFEALLMRSTLRMKNDIEIYWVSDLDDAILYEAGRRLYEQLRDNDIQIYHRNTLFKGRVGRLGITTESADMGFRFLKEYPECMFYMLPVHYDVSDRMFALINALKSQGKYVFAIKPFNDLKGMYFAPYINDGIKNLSEPIKASLRLCIDKGVDVICVGTKSIEHLEQTVEVFKGLTEMTHGG